MLLMQKDIVVAEIEILYGMISKINKIYSYKNLPVGIYPLNYQFGKDYEKDSDILNKWWHNNSIPIERSSIKQGLECLGIEDLDTLKLLARGLSLTNHYWIKESDDKATWKDVNYWDNPIDEKVGEALFDHRPVNIDGIKTGDSGLNGLLKKRWIQLNNKYYLEKSGSGSFIQEVYNEVLASDLFDIAKISHAQYNLYKKNNKISCVCSCFTSDSIELIHFTDLWDFLGNNYKTNYDRVIAIMNYFQIKNPQKTINDMLFIDYIIAGHDRHLNNFGLLHNIDTDEFVFAPIYDSGNCMWNDVTFAETISINDKDLLARPFGEHLTSGTWEKQKQFITEHPDLPISEVVEALHKYYDNLINIAKMPEERAYLIIENCLKRLKQIQLFLSDKGLALNKDWLVDDSVLNSLSITLNEPIKDNDSFYTMSDIENKIIYD